MKLINLLPPERSLGLTREYYLRLATLGALVVAFLAFSAMLLLLPTYYYLTTALATKRADLALRAAPPEVSGEFAVEEAALASRIAIVEAVQTNASASTLVRDMLAVSRRGVRVQNLNYTPKVAEKPGILLVSGVADTRESLRAYQNALLGAAFAAAAELPVAAYAKDTNIPFTITVTLRS